MPVKRKLNKKVTKMPRNVKINSKSSKRASQKKRGRSGRGRQRGGAENTNNNKYCYGYKPNFTEEQIRNILTEENIRTINSNLGKVDDVVINLISIIEGATNLNHISGQTVIRLSKKDDRITSYEDIREYITRKLPDYNANPTAAIGGDFLTMLFTKQDGSRKHKLRCFFNNKI
jgi:hypothetical protein